VLTEQQFIRDLDAAFDSLDQPTFDGLNTYYMSQAVAQAGFKVALVGTGGDELLGGYTSFRDLPALQRWSRLAKSIPGPWVDGAARLLAHLLQPRRGRIPPQTRWAKLPDMIRHGDDLLALYQLAYALFLPDFQRELLRGGSIEVVGSGLPAAMRDRLLSETAGRSSLSALSVFEQRLFLGERLLRDADATSMAASIEMRLPLVDRYLFETADRVSDRDRYWPLRNKAMLRRAGLRGLDAALFERPKSGFVLPYDRWLRRGLVKVMDQTMRDETAMKRIGLDAATVVRLWQGFLENAPGLYWSRVWAVYVLVRWCQRHQAYL
jgi:asparagine synthase (glutamine-hydrolysing)